MFIFKNAWISITRNKGRNILIGVIIVTHSPNVCNAVDQVYDLKK